MGSLGYEEQERLVVFATLAVAGATLHLALCVPAFKAFLLCILVRHGAPLAARRVPG
jgi:hypothetical protein